MKINIEYDDTVREPEITVKGRNNDPELEKIIASIRLLSNSIAGKKDGAAHFVNLSDILYFETAENKLYFYTQESMYESNLRLYEIEERFSGTPFVRVGKSYIVNLRKVRNIQSETNGRLIAQLTNNQKIVISRQYVSAIREKIANGG